MKNIQTVCQSCAMPMDKAEDFGTEAQGGQSQEYCRFCYQQGAFTWPEATLVQFTDKLVGMAEKMGMTTEQAKAMAEENLPKLKRWQKA